MSDVVVELRKILNPENIVTSRVDLVAYARDLTPYFAPPEVIVFPENREQVVEIIQLADRLRIPITPRGGGASFQGSSLPVSGGIVLDTSRMNKILEISVEDLLAVVQPGVRYETLDKALADHGLMFPHDVGSHDAASIGGILASDSNGHHGYKYGRVSPWIRELEVVMADGSVLHVGTRAPRYNMGYNLASLISGSEGTLGIITEATINLIPRPKYEASVGAFFDDLDELVKASHEITMRGVEAATLEATDGYTVKTINDVMNLGFPECEANFVGDLHAYDESDLERRANLMAEILREHGGKDIIIARDPKTIDKLWAPRLAIDVAIVRIYPGYREVGFAAADPCVPLSKQSEAIREIGRIIRSHDIIAAVFCHTGIGIIHPAVLIDPDNKEHWRAVKLSEKEILDYVISIGGVVSAEHGFGYVKNPYVSQAVGPTKLEIDRRIKDLFDPHGILNPQKMGLQTEERDKDVRPIHSAYVTDEDAWR
ncbi:MAG: FAD-binding protein [Candidatus Thorarchaeota archaeon]|nr:FAD-binding protein [Candidatus Thorarchaeota archaeon]